MSDNTLRQVEQACTELLDTGQATFTAVAARTQLAKTTLYRNQRLRAVVDEYRANQAEARTPLASPARSATCAPHSRPSPPPSGDTKNNSTNSNDAHHRRHLNTPNSRAMDDTSTIK
jgi:hypothetical protein